MFEASRSPVRILIVDDDHRIRAVLHEVLGESYDCTVAGSAEEALELLRAEKFTLVLSDIMMTGISGLELVPHVRRLSPDTVIVMISGTQTVESAIGALRAGAFDYVMKPFDLRHVLAVVRRAVEHHSLLEERRRAEEALRAAHDELESRVEERTRELTEANASLTRQIAERERVEREIQHLAYHDALTDLPNRALFEDRLGQAVLSAKRDEQMLAVMFLNLDRFKMVNDTQGHATGDLLLCEVAGRLTKCVREGDTVARFGGDEFSLLLRDISTTEDAAGIAIKIHEVLRAPFHVGGHELFTSASIGIVLYPADGAEPQTLLKNASAALYRARQQGGDNYQFYSAGLHEITVKRHSLENKLRRALERREFTVYYQPQVCTDTRRIVGMEALIRWQNPELGLISPAEFIPLAEDTGLIVPIGEWVLHTACAQTKVWHDAGYEFLKVSVNISPRQFEQPNLVETVVTILEETGLDPTDLELELTESAVMKNTAAATAKLRELKEKGIGVAIDDFGSGYSSLSYLKHLPINTLKIDQSFVRDTTTDARDAAIVMAVVTLAHNLKLNVKAEGVETEEQFRFLRLLACDEMQGYLFSRPLTAQAFEQLLAEDRRAGATADARLQPEASARSHETA